MASFAASTEAGIELERVCIARKEHETNTCQKHTWTELPTTVVHWYLCITRCRVGNVDSVHDIVHFLSLHLLVDSERQQHLAGGALDLVDALLRVVTHRHHLGVAVLSDAFDQLAVFRIQRFPFFL